jgi:hypothetical protein
MKDTLEKAARPVIREFLKETDFIFRFKSLVSSFRQKSMNILFIIFSGQHLIDLLKVKECIQG